MAPPINHIQRNSKRIDSFTGEFAFLSNFWKLNANYQIWLPEDALPDLYPTVEHAYQASKFELPFIRSKFLDESLTAGQAKRLGGKRSGLSEYIRPDWEDIKVEIMVGLVCQKFYDPDLKELLTMTDNIPIIEGNTWHDNFWGDCYCSRCSHKPGKNFLGQILMAVRAQCS